MAERGGGRLGANGSHQVDLIRWWLGEVATVSGGVATMVADRQDKETGEAFVATGDDVTHFTMQMQSGTLVTVFISAAARVNLGTTTQVFGSEGSNL